MANTMSIFKEVKELGKKRKVRELTTSRVISIPQKNLEQIIQLTICKITRI